MLGIVKKINKAIDNTFQEPGYSSVIQKLRKNHAIHVRTVFTNVVDLTRATSVFLYDAEAVLGRSCKTFV